MKQSLFILSILLAFLAGAGREAFAQNNQGGKKQPPAEAPAEPAVDSEEALRAAVQASAGSPTELIRNLDGYLQKYPNSAQRGEIEQQLYKLCVEVRDRKCAINFAERVIASNNDDTETLTNLVTMLRERREAGDLAKALTYADSLVKSIEKLINRGYRPPRLSQAQWNDRKDKALAAVYLTRGKVQMDLGNDSAAQGDLQKSYKLAKLAATAAALGEIAEKRKANDEALEQYLLAFAAAFFDSEDIDRKTIRRKLGQLYSAKHGSETGLGDRLLKTLDAYAKEREEELAKLNGPDINAGLADPLQFKLTRLDGSQFKLADLRGKIVVINFWATWCGPCLTEMPLLEKVVAKYQDDKEVIFLALSTDEERDDVAPFVKQHKFKLPFGYAEHLEDHFRVASIPTTLILDRTGEIAFRQAGFNPRGDFTSELSEHIEAAKKR